MVKSLINNCVHRQLNKPELQITSPRFLQETGTFLEEEFAIINLTFFFLKDISAWKLRDNSYDEVNLLNEKKAGADESKLNYFVIELKDRG
jgi:hypothetical protein